MEGKGLNKSYYSQAAGSARPSATSAKGGRERCEAHPDLLPIDTGNLRALNADPSHQSLLAEDKGIGIILQRGC